MEGSTPVLILLEESQKGSDFSFRTTDEQLCDWLGTPSVSSHPVEQQDKKNIIGRKEQSFSSFGNVNKGLRFHNRHLLPGGSLDELHVKFEHFSVSSQFIEQYRRAKQLRTEAVLNKLMEHKGRVLISSQEVVKSKSKSSEVSSEVSSSSGMSVASYPVLLRHHGPHDKKFVNSAKPSLPQTGYFTGKKWVYPKDIDSFNRNCGSKRCSKLQVKKPEMQVLNVHNMFLTGTGKPINTTSKKTWRKQRTICRSAPASGQRSSHKNITSPSFFVAGSSRNTIVTSTTNCTDSNSLMEGQKTCPSLHAFKKDGKTVLFGEETNYKQQSLAVAEFPNTIDFYEHCKQDTRSRAYVRIGT